MFCMAVGMVPTAMVSSLLSGSEAKIFSNAGFGQENLYVMLNVGSLQLFLQLSSAPRAFQLVL